MQGGRHREKESTKRQWGQVKKVKLEKGKRTAHLSDGKINIYR